MLNTKTIHLILLGVIVGSAAAYIYGSYRTHLERQAAIEAALSARGLPDTPEHPDFSEEEMLGLFAQALAVSPDDPELLSRLAAYLFDIGRYAESVDWFTRLLEITPDDATTRTHYATALYGSGRVGDAIQEFQRALELDPLQTLALHNLILAYLEPPRNIDEAAAALGRLESIDPAYEALPTLRNRLAMARTGA